MFRVAKHRAYQWWSADGVLLHETWYVDGNIHRIGAPASRMWNDYGAPINEVWRVNGGQHRTNGPSYQKWDDIGALVDERWCVDGKELFPEEIEKILRPDDIMEAIWSLPQPIAEEIAAVFRAV